MDLQQRLPLLCGVAPHVDHPAGIGQVSVLRGENGGGKNDTKVARARADRAIEDVGEIRVRGASWDGHRARDRPSIPVRALIRQYDLDGLDAVAHEAESCHDLG